MKNLFIISLIIILFSSCCGIKCPNGETVFRSRQSEKNYKDFTKSFELNLKGTIKVLETVDASNLDINTKNSVTKLREDLDQYSGRTSNLLMTTITRSNIAPCDEKLRDRTTILMDEMQNQSTEVEKLRISVSQAIKEKNEPSKENILKRAVTEFKGTQEEIDSKLTDPRVETVQLQKNDEWVVVFSGDKTLEESQFEKNKLDKLSINESIIILRSNSYRLVSKSFSTKNEANILLLESRSKYKKDTYIVNLKTWCSNKINKGDYFICN